MCYSSSLSLAEPSASMSNRRTNLFRWLLWVLVVLGLMPMPLIAQAQGVAIGMSAAPDPVRPGELVQYTITATNRDTAARTLNIGALVPNHTTVASNTISFRWQL
jgi:uncharacterized repeat protein (TIGR01451 family)